MIGWRPSSGGKASSVGSWLSMLRGGCDGLGNLDSGLVEEGSRVVQVAAELLQEPHVGGGLADSAPAAAGAVQDRPH